MKVPNFITTQNFMVSMGHTERQEIPAGTWCKPIEFRYLPKHVQDHPWWKHFNSDESVFTYSSYGIMPFPRKFVVAK